MDEILRVVAEYSVEFAIATVAPVALGLLIVALRRGAKRTSNKIDDAAVEALARAINERREDKEAGR